MVREWKPLDFDKVYERFICKKEFGQREYYLRYRPRYKECTKRFAAFAPSSRSADVLDIGRGSSAALAARLWNDHGVEFSRTSVLRMLCYPKMEVVKAVQLGEYGEYDEKAY